MNKGICQFKIRRLFIFVLPIFLISFQSAFAQQDGTTVVPGADSAPADTVLDVGNTTAQVPPVIKEILGQDKPKPHLYRMNYWFSAGLSIVATAANIYAIPNVIKNKPDLTDAELQSLNRSQFSSFDRWALDQNPADREKYYEYSDYVLPAIVVSAGFLAIDKKIRHDWGRVLMMYYEMHAVTFSIYNFSFFGPSFQNKLRPIVYYDQYYTAEERRGGNQRNSLYSGHVASSAASTFFMAKVYSDYHPELKRKKYLLYALASLPPLAEGYLRVKALAHFPTDIMVGFIIGATIGIATPELHKFHDRNFHIGLTTTPVGPGLSLNWQPKYKSNIYNPDRR